MHDMCCAIRCEVLQAFPDGSPLKLKVVENPLKSKDAAGVLYPLNWTSKGELLSEQRVVPMSS